MMKKASVVLWVAALLCSSSAAPAKLGADESPNRVTNLLQRGYSYPEPPAAALPAGTHFELAGPPPPPIIPDRVKAAAPFPPTPRTTTTTTPPPPPPPPSGLYGAPEADLPLQDEGPSNLNTNFVSLEFDLELPEVVEVSPTPATLPTPKGFSPPPPPTPAPAMDKSMHPYMPYNIDWSVSDPKAGQQFSHSETSHGDDVQGEYRVLLPDGRTQIVTFRADPSSGYNAAVKYTRRLA